MSNVIDVCVCVYFHLYYMGNLYLCVCIYIYMSVHMRICTFECICFKAVEDT